MCGKEGAGKDGGGSGRAEILMLLQILQVEQWNSDPAGESRDPDENRMFLLALKFKKAAWLHKPQLPQQERNCLQHGRQRPRMIRVCR